MAQVLAVQPSVDKHHHTASSGLRRNKSSQSLLISPPKASSPRRARKVSPPEEPSRTRRSKKQSSPIYDHSQDSNPSHTSSLLRRTESETILHSPHKRRTRNTSRKCDSPPITILKNTQVPPSSPLSSSPPDKSAKHIVSQAPKQIVFLKSEDDTSIKPEVSRHVDYLTYNWREEELWNSWRHIVSNRSVYGERSRLENASWRTWWKQKNTLNTLAPEKLNWYKDNDVTWLYGPLQTPKQINLSGATSESHSRLSKSNSFCGTKKPILKKRSMSELMLQRSISNSSLVRQAAAAVQAQQTRRGSVARRTSDYTPYLSISPQKDRLDYFSSTSTSGLQTPSEGSEKKHIQFADKVTQCIAVEIKGMEEEEEDGDHRTPISRFEDGYSDEEGVLMMRQTRRRSHARLPARRRSSAGENKMIEMLPATTLKDRPEVSEMTDGMSHSLAINQPWRPGGIVLSESTDTLRPEDPTKNYLIADENDNFLDDYDANDGKGSNGRAIDEEQLVRQAHEEAVRERGLRRTESGMLMHESDIEDPTMGGVVGTLLDTVNTARDIVHVIWNVGWRR